MKRISPNQFKKLVAEGKPLPENLSVAGYLNLYGCTGLTALPENLSVDGDLYLEGCTGLRALPENLSVDGYLNLYGCTGLRTLPENLSVAGYLDLGGCTKITALPGNLKVKGSIWVDETFFERIPKHDLPLMIGLDFKNPSCNMQIKLSEIIKDL